MKNYWNNKDLSDSDQKDPVSLRVYTSRLLGADSSLVLHGGGNTSVKAVGTNVFGDSQRILYVKGSGWDLRTIETPGFPPTDLDYLLRLGELSELTDSDMMKHLRLALLDPKAPTPSVEAILHALIPHKFVDHTHADSVVAISNSPDGEEVLAELYGEEVLILPYIMPGFVLARQIAAASVGVDWDKLKGIVLLHHGIFTFSDDAKTSYDTMIELVERAESYLESKIPSQSLASGEYSPTDGDMLDLSKLRQLAGAEFGGPVVLQFDASAQAAGFAQLEDCESLATQGPLTPDHTLHTKAFAAIFDDDLPAGLAQFSDRYLTYFNEFAESHHQCLDKMPRYGVWQGKGLIYFAANPSRLNIVKDIISHTIQAIQRSEAIGGWKTLPQSDLFAVEYWELEQAKLKTGSSRNEFDGKVALVTGAASGIGAACVEALLKQGAAVVGLDYSEGFGASQNSTSQLSLQCDVTDAQQLKSAIDAAVLKFGGIDMLVSNAGVFPASQTIENMDDLAWDKSMDLNLSSHMRILRSCLAYLKNGFDPSVVIVGSKNVAAPGPGAAAYSAAKAGLAQLARVAALELGEAGIRVNTIHPNAVFDTGVWTQEVLQSRADNYGMSVAEYKTNNVLKAEVTSVDVANVILQFLGSGFSKTTGAQIPVDAGNDRVI